MQTALLGSAMNRVRLSRLSIRLPKWGAVWRHLGTFARTCSALTVLLGAAWADGAMEFDVPKGAKDEDLKKCVQAMQARFDLMAKGATVKAPSDTLKRIRVEMPDAWIEGLAAAASDELKKSWEQHGGENWKVGYAARIASVLGTVPAKKVEILALTALTEEEQKRYKSPDYDDASKDRVPGGSFWCRSSPAASDSKECFLLKSQPVIANGEIRKVGRVSEKQEWLDAYSDRWDSEDAASWWFVELDLKASARTKALLNDKAAEKVDGIIWVVDGKAWPHSRLALPDLKEYVLEGKDGKAALLLEKEGSEFLTVLVRNPLPLALTVNEEDEK